MKTITRMISDEVFEGVSESGNTVRIDTRKVEERQNQSPTELLLSALAACGAVESSAATQVRPVPLVAHKRTCPQVPHSAAAQSALDL